MKVRTTGDLNIQPGALTAREEARLAGILSRLSSSFEGERAAAGLLATVFLERHGLTWGDVLAPGVARPVPTAGPAPKQDRRRASKLVWRGYECRRARPSGAALDLSA